MDSVPKMKFVLREYVFLKNLRLLLLVVKINVKMLTKSVLMANAGISVKSTIYVPVKDSLTVLITIPAIALVLVLQDLNVKPLKIATTECFVKREAVSQNLNVIMTKSVKERIKSATVESVLCVQKNVYKILIVKMGYFVRITRALIVDIVINVPVAIPVAKWDVKRTNAIKMKIAKKTARFAITMNADEVATLSGNVNFMSFAVRECVNTKNVRDRAHAAD